MTNYFWSDLLDLLLTVIMVGLIFGLGLFIGMAV